MPRLPGPGQLGIEKPIKSESRDILVGINLKPVSKIKREFRDGWQFPLNDLAIIWRT